MSKALFRENIENAQREIQARKADMCSAKMRQRFHFMAEEGWINDPNGLIFYKGKYHFFYQCNPYGSFWDTIYWGHAVSDDMFHWEYLPLALAPSESYDNCERGGCFSGSAIEWNGKLYLIYTGTSKDGEDFVQTQCLAWSEDGIHFEKYEGNPVITPPEWIRRDNFRDPKVWRKGDSFFLVCGGRKGDLAQALLYRSRDLVQWEFVNVMFESRGEYGYMFECPDFYSLDGMDVFTFSIMGAHERTNVYMVGKMDYESGKFHPVRSGEFDWGFDFYAPQTFLDAKGRRIMVSWANAWDWMPWWRDWGPAYKEGWCGFFNVPREVSMLPDYSLRFKWIEELRDIQCEKKTLYGVEISGRQKLDAGDGVSCQIKAVIDLERTTAPNVTFVLRSNGKRETLVTLNLKKGMLSVDRNRADGWSKDISKSTLMFDRDNKELDIDILIDQSSIEVFAAKYQMNHSCNIYPDSSQINNYIEVQEGCVYLKSLFMCGIERTMDCQDPGKKNLEITG